MVLKSLEMQGFKSFPDKTVMEFDKGMTAVIGPNGSGKSNISDAVRWVLGEQSTKSLRGAKMEDVVFSGTALRRAQGFAEVTLRLDNRDRSLAAYEMDEVSVTRKYYRSGESEYRLNGEPVRLRDVHELFMDTGLGRDGYSLVSQGRVADLVSSRSTQRRDMLEEAAGISHFRYRRTDANRRLTQAEENLVRLRDILSELEGRVGPLKIQSEKAQKYLMLANEKREVEIGLYLHTIEKSKVALKEQEHRLNLANLQYNELNEELAALEAAIEAGLAKGQEITLKIEEVRQGAAEFEEQATVLEGQISIEENSIEHNKATIDRITRDMETAAQTQSHIGEQIALAESEIMALEQQIAQREADLAELTAAAQGIREKSRSFSAQMQEITQQRMDTAAALSDKRVAQSTASSTAGEIRARLAEITENSASRGLQAQEATRQQGLCKAELDALRETRGELENAIEGYRMLANTRAAKTEKLKKEAESAAMEMQQKAARAKMLEDLEKSMEGYSGSVKAVMREAVRGMLTGLHKPLSQLITVEDSCAVAVETALGAAVQNIVTDTENDAKRAIEFLKRSHAGRATFLPLSAIRPAHFNEKGVDKCPGYVGMADTLVSADAQYRDILSSQLGRTVVMERIDDAIAAAKRYGNRFRIVTLDGQVLNVGGSMTGGSQTRSAGILSRANEIEALRIQIEKMQTALGETQSRYKNAQAESAAAAAELDGTLADLSNTQEAIIRKESELRVLTERMESAQNALADFEREKNALRGRLSSLEQDDSALHGEIEQLQAVLDALDAAMAGHDSERQALAAALEENAESAAQHNLQIVALQKDIQAKRESIEALGRRGSAHGDRMGDLSAEIGGIASQSLEMKEKIVALREQAEALRAQSAQTKETVAGLLAQRRAAEEEMSRHRAQEKEKNAAREGLSGELARLEERRNAANTAMEEALNHLFEEYQLTQREAIALEIELEDAAAAQRRLNEIKGKIRVLGTVNVGAVEEYREVAERYEFMKVQIDDIEHSRMELLRMIADLTAKMAERFSEQFEKINRCFAETFTHLFDGGKAELLMENPLDLLESQIEIRVQPPGKNVQNIDLLSGGEKGLSAIALLFAILKITPAPFCIFDEVEAALDDVNVSRYAQYVRHMTGSTQFILITHRRGTMEEADVLYGVTMQEEGVSKMLRLKTAEMAKELGIA